MNFSNKVVLVTGAAVGIGRKIAVDFAKRGAKVAVNFSKSRQDAEETLKLIAEAGGDGMLCQCDVSDEKAVPAMIDAVVEKFGRLDILVNNTGITRFIDWNDLDGATGEAWETLYRVNVMGMFFCSRAAAKVMPEGGVIVNIASVSGHAPNGSSIPYSVSKAAVLHLTKCLAKALSPRLRVVSVSPGVIADTRWNAGRDVDAVRAKGAELSLSKRVGTPEEISQTVLFLASDGGAFCNGTDVNVDGGRFLVV